MCQIDICNKFMHNKLATHKNLIMNDAITITVGVSFALPMFYFFLQKMNQYTILINNFNKNKLSYK